MKTLPLSPGCYVLEFLFGEESNLLPFLRLKPCLAERAMITLSPVKKDLATRVNVGDLTLNSLDAFFIGRFAR